jgi:hypothetical protein
MVSHAVAQECVVLLKANRQKAPAKVGKSWQPDVAQFLLDMYPGALDNGLELSDIAMMVSSDIIPMGLFSYGFSQDLDLDEIFEMEEDDDV